MKRRDIVEREQYLHSLISTRLIIIYYLLYIMSSLSLDIVQPLFVFILITLYFFLTSPYVLSSSLLPLSLSSPPSRNKLL